MQLLWGAMAGFGVAALACPVLAALAPRLGLVDLPDARKQHAGAVPLVGGIGVMLAFVLSAWWGGRIGYFAEFAGPLALMFAVGLADDVHDLSARLKLLCQIVAASWLVWVTQARIDALPLPFLAGHFALGWAAQPLAVLLVVAILNAINMIDGLDGLAGGCLLVACVVLALAAAAVGRQELAMLAGWLAAALCGFLLWNARWPWQARARVFLGDAGTLSLGLLLCWLILRLSLSWRGFDITRVPLTVVLAPVAVPLADLVVVSFWRAAEGRNPMRADRGHSHHLLLGIGFSAVAAVRLMWVAAMLIGGATFCAWRAGVQEGRLLGVLLACLLGYLVWFRLNWLRVRRLQQ